jgi:cobalt-zinc-cadmium efflux system membrane fusion protein
MNAEIEIKNKNVYALPEDAIVRYQNNLYVFLAVSEKEYTIQEVKTGDAENGYVEILSGESLINKPVVVKGAYNLLMAMKNKVEE